MLSRIVGSAKCADSARNAPRDTLKRDRASWSIVRPSRHRRAGLSPTETQYRLSDPQEPRAGNGVGTILDCLVTSKETLAMEVLLNDAWTLGATFSFVVLLSPTQAP